MNNRPWPSAFAELEQQPRIDDLEFNGLIAGSVFFAVCLPPPLHGQSLVDASVIRAAQRFAGSGKIEIADIGPGRRNVGFQYHLTRMFRVVLAMLMLLKRGVKANQQLYTVFESGLGVGYNFLIIGLARVLGYNIILHHHTSKHTLTRQRRFGLLQRIAGSSCLHVVLSEEMADNMRFLYPAIGNILVSQNACHIPDGELKLAPSLRSNRLRVGFLSNLCHEKGLDVALDAATKCRDRGLEMTFVFAGPTVGQQAADILSQARDRLGDYIEILGPVTGEAKAAFFESIDIFLFPTRYRFEAQPLVLLEAMSYGLPVITTHCGYVAELVGCQGIVLNVDEKLSDRIAEQLERLVASHDDYRRWEAIEIKSYFRQLRATAMSQLRDLMNALFALKSAEKIGPASMS
ncbi:glycosyltransferase family 4 protein [Methylocapsa aurea]|uniref:glycosyltransferase family 4 protein n=1 Tax=Methylocapsa aurea TaxID=663610 RepID=UPI00068F591E|nr:glycosyltransferase family 4 protein [Methylocapsa aurea]